FSSSPRVLTPLRATSIRRLRRRRHFRRGRPIGMKPSTLGLAALSIACLIGGPAILAQPGERKGYDISESGLVPRYPAGFPCSPLTAPYASWIDVDGTRRSERHSGVDGGKLGDPVLSPAPGVVRAAWQTDWGWGHEGALLIRHSSEQLGLPGTKFYYSEFD